MTEPFVLAKMTSTCLGGESHGVGYFGSVKSVLIEGSRGAAEGFE